MVFRRLVKECMVRGRVLVVVVIVVVVLLAMSKVCFNQILVQS